MTVTEAIESYLSHQRGRGLEPGSVRTTGHALRTVLEPVLGAEVLDLAANGVGDVLRTALERRVNRTSRKPLTPTTRELYLNAAKAFLAWAVGKGWMRANPLDPAPAAPPAAPKHLGALVRRLREAAGLTRMKFEEQVGLSATTIKGIDLGRYRPTRAQLDRLLQHRAMADLMTMAERAGIPIDLAPESEPEPNREIGGEPAPEDPGGGGSSPGD